MRVYFSLQPQLTTTSKQTVLNKTTSTKTTTMPTTLFATPAAVVASDAVARAVQLATGTETSADVLTHVLHTANTAGLPAAVYDTVVVQSDAPISDAASWLGALGRCLKATGQLVVVGGEQQTVWCGECAQQHDGVFHVASVRTNRHCPWSSSSRALSTSAQMQTR